MQATAIETFEAYRGKLIGVAYRITGSISEAEDIAQETFLKWADADHTSIHSPQAWLIKVATRMALDHLKSAKVQRQVYIGPWLPEPFIEDEEIPENRQELDESITMALLLLLEQLSPDERASFILHDLFHFNFEETADILGKTSVSCRKLASRARQKIDTQARQTVPDKHEHLAIVNAFFSAVKQGNMEDLLALLQEDAVLHTDGGGKAIAALEILNGAETVAEFLLQKVSPAFAATDSGKVEKKYIWFNGAPGLVLWWNAEPITAFNFEVENRAIKKIHALRNPDKLKFFGLQPK